MRGLIMFIFIGATFHLCAQTGSETTTYDASYLEDQFYVGVTYNILLNKPNDVTQRNLSYGLHMGFLKDIPLNRKRTIAFGIGVGYAVNSDYTNLFANKSENGIEYSVLGENEDYKRNKLETHLVEFPLELRWRNSTASSYKFWRIYSGVKFGYVFEGRSKFVSDTQRTSFSNTDIREFQYGITLNFGYNTFNIHAYYALNSMFNDETSITNGEVIAMKPLRIGLIFYIL